MYTVHNNQNSCGFKYAYIAYALIEQLMLIPEAFNASLCKLHYNIGHEVLYNMVQKSFLYDIHSRSYFNFQRSKLMWTDFSDYCLCICDTCNLFVNSKAPDKKIEDLRDLMVSEGLPDQWVFVILLLSVNLIFYIHFLEHLRK